MEKIVESIVHIETFGDIERQRRFTIKNGRRLTSGLASGGVLARGTLYRHFGISPPVQAFVNPRPTAKPPGVIGKACAKICIIFFR